MPVEHVDVNAEPLRLAVEPSTSNGLLHRSYVMVDKIVTLPKNKIGRRVGRLSAPELKRLGQHLLIFLGMTE